MGLIKMKEIASRFLDIKSIVSSFLTVVVACIALYSYTDKFVQDIQDAIYEHVTEDFYGYAKSDLLKQLDKLKDDPEDMKMADIYKFSDLCSGYLGNVYAKRSPDQREIKIACGIIHDLHEKDILSK